MDYEVIMSEADIKTYPSPHLALAELKIKLNAKISEDGKNPLHYITQTSNEGKSLKATATYSEDRKKHFDANPL